MAFELLEIKDEYRSKPDNIARDFYHPILKQAVTYDRAVGYFSSTALIAISSGLLPFINNGGVIRLIASPKLNIEDIQAIEQGYQLREKVIEKAAIRELYEPKDFMEEQRLALLAKLIEDSKLEIKLALVDNYGMYHEKMGIFTDNDGQKIAFAGSMNETLTGIDVNYETIDVFCSWQSEYERKKVSVKDRIFNSLWNNKDTSIEVRNFQDVDKEIIKKYNKIGFSYENFQEGKNEEKNYPHIPSSIELYDYQLEAIENWKKNNYRGIFDMATGTGKTYTGISALCSLYDYLEGRLISVIVCPFTHLVEQWVEDLKVFGIHPIIAYGINKYKDYPQKIRKAIFEYKLGKRKNVCIITTKDTFSSEKFDYQLKKATGNICLMVDEVHNMGAPTYLEKLDNRYNYRLGLSATLERHYDIEGTTKLYEYFGPKCIEYSLEQAIDDGKLTPYDYHPVCVILTEEELEKYNAISFEMSQNVIIDKMGNSVLNEYGKMLAIKRSRIVAGASNKINALMRDIENYKNESHILVYCGATTIKEENNVDDIRQIDMISKKLGLELGMNVAQFTSNENAKQREILKNEFSDGSSLQALIAIKCLDEGVNIPAIKMAFILASTTNPKEYIQRRGRVLRLFEGKRRAIIYDYITLPHDPKVVTNLSMEETKFDKSLVRNELKRVEEFQRLSDNSYESQIIIREIKEAFQLYSDIEEVEYAEI